MTQFRLVQGVQVPDLSGIEEGYSVKRVPAGYHVFTVNVSADNIPRVFRHLAATVAEPGFLTFELPSHGDVEEQLRKSPSDPFHRDVYYLDGLAWVSAEEVFASYEFLLTNDGMINFGFGSLTGRDEVFVDAYKVFKIFADDPQKYHSALGELGYAEVPLLKTVWQNFSQESPGSRNVLSNREPTIWQMVEQLTERGLYLDQRRED